jgi:ABC-type Fe3+-siderophore transport system permease subunit
MNDKNKNKEDSKEGFCSACVMGITALAGAGTMGASTKVNKKRKKIIFWIGFIVSIISIFILLYLLLSGCSKCK